MAVKYEDQLFNTKSRSSTISICMVKLRYTGGQKKVYILRLPCFVVKMTNSKRVLN